jgi:diacylglycerol O-acyltransferase
VIPLTGPDEVFLHLESPTRPLHTLKVAVTEAEDGYRFEDLRELIVRRLDRVPALRWRLAPAPLHIGRKGWIEDRELVLDRHLHRVTAEPPGGTRELCEAISRTAAAGVLPRDRPLWEWWVVEGLEGGRFASVIKLHHAVADGVSSARMLLSFFGEEDPGIPAPLPAGGDVRDVVADAARRSAAFARAIGSTAAGTAAALRARGSLSEAARGAPVPPHGVPATVFNRTLGPRRVFACSSLEMSDVLARKAAHGATVNDVFLAAVAGATRRYLQACGGLPAERLVARVPVSTLEPGEQGYFGNRGLRTMYVQLPTDVDDPDERIAAARDAARAAKERFDALAGGRQDDWLAVLPGTAIRGLGPVMDSARAQAHPRAGNLVVSNVRGPAEALEADGFRLVEFYSIGPCLPGSGLNITAWSFGGRFNVSLVADPEVVPDHWRLIDQIRTELTGAGAAASA